jgi:hypothetical protein
MYKKRSYINADELRCAAWMGMNFTRSERTKEQKRSTVLIKSFNTVLLFTLSFFRSL